MAKDRVGAEGPIQVPSEDDKPKQVHDPEAFRQKMVEKSTEAEDRKKKKKQHAEGEEDDAPVQQDPTAPSTDRFSELMGKKKKEGVFDAEKSKGSTTGSIEGESGPAKGFEKMRSRAGTEASEDVVLNIDQEQPLKVGADFVSEDEPEGPAGIEGSKGLGATAPPPAPETAAEEETPPPAPEEEAASPAPEEPQAPPPQEQPAAPKPTEQPEPVQQESDVPEMHEEVGGPEQIQEEHADPETGKPVKEPHGVKKPEEAGHKKEVEKGKGHGAPEIHETKVPKEEEKKVTGHLEPEPHEEVKPHEEKVPEHGHVEKSVPHEQEKPVAEHGHEKTPAHLEEGKEKAPIKEEPTKTPHHEKGAPQKMAPQEPAHARKGDEQTLSPQPQSRDEEGVAWTQGARRQFEPNKPHHEKDDFAVFGISVERKEKSDQEDRGGMGDDSHDQQQQQEQLIEGQSSATPMQVESVAPTEQAQTPSQTSMHPQVFALFETMVKQISVEKLKDATKTTVHVEMPGSKFDGAQIVIERFASAQNTFNIQIHANPEAMQLLNQNLPQLENSLQALKGEYQYNLQRPVLLSDFQVLSRKEQGDSGGQQQQQDDEREQKQKRKKK